MEGSHCLAAGFRAYKIYNDNSGQKNEGIKDNSSGIKTVAENKGNHEQKHNKCKRDQFCWRNYPNGTLKKTFFFTLQKNTIILYYDNVNKDTLLPQRLN